MFGMKTSTKLTAVKIDLINIFLQFFLHKSVNQPQSWSKKKKSKILVVLNRTEVD